MNHKIRNCIHCHFQSRGVAGLEVMVIIVVLLAAVTIAIPLILNKTTGNRDNKTYKKILSIKKAIVGDPQLAERGNRSSFGFVGDLGILPANLTELIQKAAGRPDYNNISNVWFGWKGPYIDSTVDDSGNYAALLDAWGRAFDYTYTAGNSSTWNAEIRSFGPDGIKGNGDDIYEYISDLELRTYISGTFRDRSGSPVSDSMVTVYFPNGTATLDSVQISTNPAIQSQYDSQFDTVSNEYKRKIPIGIRYLETLDLQLRKLASLNSGTQSKVNFVSGEIIELQSELFERTFRPTDNEPDNQFKDVYTAGGNREIINNTEISGGGYLTISGSAMSWPDDTTIIGFGTSQWDDYRIEANILHGNGHKYQVFYRMSNLGYDPDESNDDLKIKGTGYGFEFDPQTNSNGDYVDNTSVGKVILRIWKYQNGLPRSILEEKEYTNAAFQSRFRYPILWRAHQVSITIQNVDASIIHHVLINGRDVFDDDIVDSGISSTGSAGILVHSHTNFKLYHLLVHKVPPQSDLPFVWWSFEEGFDNGNNYVYGFGYLNNAQVLIGELENPSNINRQWDNNNIHGQAIYANGTEDGYINFGNILDIYPTDAVTISVWIKILSFNPANQYVVLSKRRSRGNDRGWELLLTRESDHNFGVEFAIQQRENGHGNQRVLINLNDLNDEIGVQANLWYHIAVVYDGTQQSGGYVLPSALQIYVTPEDANVVESSPPWSNIESTLRTNSQTTHNESLTLGVGRNHENPFRGFIDEIKIFNRVLDSNEINELFQKDK